MKQNTPAYWTKIDWSPSELTSAQQHIDTITTLIDQAAQQGKLSKRLF